MIGRPAVLILVTTLGLSCVAAHAWAAPATASATKTKPAHPATQPEIIPADDANILHLLNRLSFGPAPGDIERVKRMGIDAYIEGQLNPVPLTTAPILDATLKSLPTQNMSLLQLASDYQAPPDKKDLPEDERKAINEHQNGVLRETMQAKLARAIMSPNQLQEVMVDFWFNHFNVFVDKSADTKIFIGAYERDAIRPYALGKFRDLLLATAEHPAMLIYLDNWLNTDPFSPAARGKKIGINENYAREVMELHTLGVDGGYTQADVTTLAHILTGWGLGTGPGLVPHAQFVFDPKRHDASNLLFLNTEIHGGGADEVADVLAMLANEPATVHHIAYQLAQYFVADQPPPALVNRLAAVYRQSDGDIKTVLRALFYSREFWEPQYRQNKFKPPYRYVVSALRAGGIVPQGDMQRVYGAINQMGEPLYRCLTPNGYAITNDQWLNSDALLKRVDFARGLSGIVAKMGGNPNTLADTMVASFGDNWGADTIISIKSAEPNLRPVLTLSSPEFVYY